MSTKMRVAVIGAGQAGLCALRHLSQYPDKFSVVCFEGAEEIGGNWLYSEKTGKDKYGMPVFSTMYDKVVINMPLILMETPDFPHENYQTAYVDRHYIFQYLQRYATKYDLRKYVKFYTIVKKVRPLSNEQNSQWELSYFDVRNQTKIKTDIFDAVLVCHGHNAKPYYPNIPGLELFQGTVLHSKNYRNSSVFKGKTVVILGASHSGLDFSLQISECAKKVFLAHVNDRLRTPMPANVHERPGIKRVTKNSVLFEDDSEEKVDAIILCTGYRYNMQFLDDVVKVKDEHVTPVYKHLIHIEHPTLMFIGLPKEFACFRQNYETCHFVTRYLMGLVKLPSKQEMYEDVEKDLEYRKSLGIKDGKAHNLGVRGLQWRWNREIAKLGGFEPIPQLYEKMWDKAIENMHSNFMNFRKYVFEITGPDSFEARLV